MSGLRFAPVVGMKEPSEGRKRVLALQQRALKFSNHINQSYPSGAINHPSRVVWDQLVRAADGTSLVREADELAAIFATIIMNMEKRLAREGKERKKRRERT